MNEQTSKATASDRGLDLGLDPVKLAKEGQLFDLLELYLQETSSAEEGASAGRGRNSRYLPNVAGFCRFLGIGTSRLSALREADPETYDALNAVFEDEALNSGISASLLTPYFRKRLGYAERERETALAPSGYDANTENGSIRILFDHDVYEDGA